MTVRGDHQQFIAQNAHHDLYVFKLSNQNLNCLQIG